MLRTQLFAAAVCATALTAGVSAGDDPTGFDLNPADFRGGPLSVFAHWKFDDSGESKVTTNTVDDNDPSTTLSEVGFSVLPDPNEFGTVFRFNIANWIDEEPVKHVRIQIIWEFPGTTPPPPGILRPHVESVIGFEADPTTGQLTKIPGEPKFWSDPFPILDIPGGGDRDLWYQYHDYMMMPNPDWEQVNIFFPHGIRPVEVIFDTISIPGPGSAALAGLGGLVAVRRRR